MNISIKSVNKLKMPPPGFEPGEWDPQSHVLSRLHHRGKEMKNSAV